MTMREVCLALGWVDEHTGEPTANDMQRLRRRLRRVEQDMGRRLVWGGGRGGRGGGGCWTTIQALRAAGLLDDFEALAEEAAGLMAELRTELREDIDLLDDRQRAMAKAVRKMLTKMSAMCDQLGIAD